jgi:two-component system sensor histidine kinase TtrS
MAGLILRYHLRVIDRRYPYCPFDLKRKFSLYSGLTSILLSIESAPLILKRKVGACLSMLLIMAGLLPGIIRANTGEVTIGVLAHRGIDRARQMWTPTVDYLSARILDRKFTLLPLDLYQMSEALEEDELDFILTNPGHYVELEAAYGVTRIATLKNLRQGKLCKVFGAVIFTRADRHNIRTLADLNNKSFAAVDEAAFGGFQMAWRELQEAGINPFTDFTELRFTGFPQDAIVFQVLNGEIDAGTVRTDTMERMTEQGLIDLRDFRILNAHLTEDFPFQHSTRLYPEWAFAKTKTTADELARMVVIALLEMPPDNQAARAGHYAGWTVPLDYQPVHELFQALEIGPYSNAGEITLIDVLQRYWYWLALLLSAILFSLFHIVRIERQVNYRTAELSKTNTALEYEVVVRKEAEVASQSLLEENRYLIRKSLLVQEEERRSLARELHDELGQCITAIQADARTIRELSTCPDDRVCTSADAILQVSSRIYDVVHSMIQRMRPDVLDDLGLVEALKELINDFKEHYPEVDCQLYTSVEEQKPGMLGERVNITIYRIVQESLTNIIKYAAASRVAVRLKTARNSADIEYNENVTDFLVLEVKDNGRGMDLSGTQPGLGMIGMRERAEALGGKFQVESSGSEGTTLTTIIPLPAATGQGEPLS